MKYYRQVMLKIPGIAGGNTQTEFIFPDQPDLRYARMLSMAYYCRSDLQVAYPEPIPLVPAAQVPLIAFRFETNDPDDTINKDLKKTGGDDGRFSKTLETIQAIPAAHLRINQDAATTSFVRNGLYFPDTYVVWQKSKVQIAPGGLGNTTDLAIVLGVFYTFTNSKGKIIDPRN